MSTKIYVLLSLSYFVLQWNHKFTIYMCLNKKQKKSFLHICEIDKTVLKKLFKPIKELKRSWFANFIYKKKTT